MPRPANSTSAIAKRLQASASPSVTASTASDKHSVRRPDLIKATPATPQLILVVIDTSSSQGDRMAGCPTLTKLEAGLAQVNWLIGASIAKCKPTPDEMSVYDSVYFGVVLYGGDQASPLYPGTGTVPSSEMLRLRRMDDRVQPDGSMKKTAVYVDATPNGGTPMKAGLALAAQITSDWCAGNPNAPAPLVFHVSDGESTDGDPTAEMTALRDLSTAAGNTTLWNLHLGTETSTPATPIMFGGGQASFPDAFSRLMFEQSSPMPQSVADLLSQSGVTVEAGARCFASNAKLEGLTLAIKVGSQVVLR
jgi:hypothetical protein